MSRLTMIAALLLVAAAPAGAQDRASEVEELEAMLERVDAALAQLAPLSAPPVSFAQYDIRHLLSVPQDREAPTLSIPSESAGYRTGNGGGTFSFDSAEDCGAVLDTDQIEMMLTRAVGEDEWDGPRSIEVHRGFVLVRQTAIGHGRIRALLDDLSRRATRSVQLEVGFYALPPELEAEVRAAAIEKDGALDRAVLERLDRAVAAGGARLVGNAMLTALNGQRVYLHQGDERAYVSDYERSSGGTGEVVEVVTDAIVDVLRSGLALDVRSTILDGDEPRAALDVRFVRSKPLSLETRDTPWGPIMAPQVTIDSVRTSAQVPAGSGMLVFAARGTADDGTTDVVIIVRPRSID
jgi:hypothetical protein